MRALLILAVVGLLVAACGAEPAPSATPDPVQGVALLTQPPPGPNFACQDALAGGTLAADPRSGLGLRTESGVMPVSWPFGFAAARADGVLVLIDDAGRALAREGDPLSVPGGMGANGLWFACPPITVGQPR
jgi:hypothetical protein